MKRTYMPKAGEIESRWFVIDATDMILGRLSSFVAYRLRGKHLPEYVPHQLTGDTIVVINADKIRVTGGKEQKKLYHSYTGFRVRTRTFAEQMQKNSAFVIEKAVKGMLPKNVMGRQLFRRLKVYPGADHPHAAQQPADLKVRE